MKKEELAVCLKNQMDVLSLKIKTERGKRGWDIIDLSIKSRTSQATLYNMEAGISDNITLKSLIGIAIAFETTPELLLAQAP